MFEGQNTGFNTGLAKRMAPKGRPPTANDLWEQRLLRALDTCSPADGRRYRELVSEMCALLGTKDTIVDGKWAPNPHYRDPVRWRELWEEVGDLLGIGPPPAISTKLA
jgi:hypothetical protein